MRLNPKALLLASGILWMAAFFITGVGNLIWPEYGRAFLQIWASVYPGYHATRSVGDLIVGTIYAFVDAAVMGLLFGWLYNTFIPKGPAS